MVYLGELHDGGIHQSSLLAEPALLLLQGCTVDLVLGYLLLNMRELHLQCGSLVLVDLWSV